MMIISNDNVNVYWNDENDIENIIDIINDNEIINDNMVE